MKVNVLNKAISKKNVQRIKRRLRIRGKISGTADRPRLSFFRSNKNLQIQAINDRDGVTLASLSTYEAAFKSDAPTVETAKKIGVEFASRLKTKNITEVVFDRNGYKYHGVLKSFVDSLREAGIKV